MRIFFKLLRGTGQLLTTETVNFLFNLCKLWEWKLSGLNTKISWRPVADKPC